MATEVSEGSSPKILKQDQEAFSIDLVVSTSAATLGFTDKVPMSPVHSSRSGSQISEDLHDNVSEYDNYHENALKHDEDCSNDDLINLQAQFDSLKISAGIEVSLLCLEDFSSTPDPADLSTSTVPSKFATRDIIVSSQPGCTRENKENDEVAVLEKFRLFKQFDTVQDYSDHHFTHGDSKLQQATPMWKKTIQQEWKILEKDLPDTIFVRGYEERMDLLRAVVVGTPGTPYHGSLFFFDFFFPSDYPNVPPQVFYYSGGLQLNRNLSVCGKVCLSLLNDWPEKWTPGKSTVLQVLLSIQARVLNDKPYFSEPGFEEVANKHEEEVESKDYNEDTFVQSCKTMLYMMSRPPKHYEDFVAGYFHVHAHKILETCQAYVGGAEVGPVQDRDGQTKGGSQKFKVEVSDILPRLLQEFQRNGAVSPCK